MYTTKESFVLRARRYILSSCDSNSISGTLIEKLFSIEYKLLSLMSVYNNYLYELVGQASIISYYSHGLVSQTIHSMHVIILARG